MNRQPDILLDVIVEFTIYQWCLRVAFKWNLPGRKKINISKVWKIPHRLTCKGKYADNYRIMITVSCRKKF